MTSKNPEVEKINRAEWWRSVPGHWRVARLKYLATKIGSGKTPLGGATIYSASGVAFLRSQNVHASGLRLDDLVYISRELDATMASTRVEPQDVLLNITGASLGRCALVPECLGSANVNQHVCIVRTDRSSLFAPYLNYLLSSRPLQDKIFAGEDGVSREGLTFDRIGNFTLAIPAAIAQQQEICVFLDRETGRITAAIEKKERLVTLLEEKRTALINGAVTRGLGPAVAMRDSGSHLLGMIPRHWEVKRLLYFTHPARPVMYGIVLPGPNVADGVPIVKGGDVAPGRLRLDLLNRTTREIESSYARSRLRGGDIVYAIRGSIGSAELVPPELCGANLTQDAARISPSTGVDGRWLLYALKAHCTFAQVDCGAMGATIRGVNIRDLKRVILPVPPLHEQSAIVEYLSLATTALDKAIAKILEQISKLQEYRTALISAAVTGKIDLRGSAET